LFGLYVNGTSDDTSSTDDFINGAVAETIVQVCPSGGC